MLVRAIQSTGIGGDHYDKPRGRMHRTEQFIVNAERDVKIIEAMRRAMYAMELVNLAIVEMDEARWRLNFSFEIQQLAEALHLIGVEDDELLLRPPRV